MIDDPKIIYGKKLAAQYEGELKEEVKKLGFAPCGVNILIGDDPSSVLYTQIKEKKAQEIGIDLKTLRFSLGGGTNPPPRWDDVVQKIEEMNKDPNIYGIMIQLPVPEDFLEGHSLDELLGKIDSQKDIDGLHYARKRSTFVPAAVKAVLMILEDEKINVRGKTVIVLGKSNLVGKPVAEELKKMGAQVTVCDSQTKNLSGETQKADIIISATGVPGILTGEMIKEGVVVIDVGAEKVGGKLKGDVDFSSVYPKASKITPVPGGVGPVTVIALLKNLVEIGNKFRV